jgi:hypothetical protein
LKQGQEWVLGGFLLDNDWGGLLKKGKHRSSSLLGGGSQWLLGCQWLLCCCHWFCCYCCLLGHNWLGHDLLDDWLVGGAKKLDGRSLLGDTYLLG